LAPDLIRAEEGKDNIGNLNPRKSPMKKNPLNLGPML
jgi:hypothetical protein